MSSSENCLSGKEILQRLIEFNETNNWEVFDDVPPEQQHSVMYPHMTKEALIKMKEIYNDIAS